MEHEMVPKENTMYKMYENLFDGLMEDLNPVFDGLNKAITKAPEACAVTSPMNVFKEEDGSYGVEVAVVGKTKEDIKLSARTEMVRHSSSSNLLKRNRVKMKRLLNRNASTL